jgi:hypothetical protein
VWWFFRVPRPVRAVMFHVKHDVLQRPSGSAIGFAGRRALRRLGVAPVCADRRTAPDLGVPDMPGLQCVDPRAVTVGAP